MSCQPVCSGRQAERTIYLPDGQVVKLNPTSDGKFELTVVKSTLNSNVFSQGSQKYQQLSLDGRPTLLSAAGISVEGDPNQNNIISKLGWQAVVHQDQAEALKPVETQTRNDLLLAVIVTLLAAVAAVGLAQVLAGPIIRLNAIAEKVIAGDLSVQAKVETSDETGTLASTFNKMVSQLNGLIGSLEERVADRTKALTTSAEVSRRLSQSSSPRQLAVDVVEQFRPPSTITTPTFISWTMQPATWSWPVVPARLELRCWHTVIGSRKDVVLWVAPQKPTPRSSSRMSLKPKAGFPIPYCRKPDLR